MRNGPQATQDHIQQARRQHHGVTPGEQHVPDLGRLLDIIDLGVKLLATKGLPGVSHNAAAGAVATITGALGGDQHQHAVGVAVHQAWHRRVLVLGQRVFHHRTEGNHFPIGGYNLLANRAAGIVGIDEAGEVGSYVNTKESLAAKCFLLGFG